MGNTLTKSEPTAKEATPATQMGPNFTKGNTVGNKKRGRAARSKTHLALDRRGNCRCAVCIVSVPWVREMMNTISTDDAYVNGHVTYVAARISGQVANVFVEENNVVRKGDLLLELDSEPYQVQVNIAQAAVDAAKADLVAAKAQVNGLQAQVRSYQFSLQHAIEDVHNKVAELRGTVAELETAKAKQSRATADYNRALSLQKANRRRDQSPGYR